MKRLILIALIPALVGCVGMPKPAQLLGATMGAVAGYQLGKSHKDQDWAIGLGTLTGLMIGRY
jgi:hypothetical protein|tara:strand:- start:62 stop:250 length:189 start_codon:yes stop_codon:yes gene_type:complete